MRRRRFVRWSAPRTLLVALLVVSWTAPEAPADTYPRQPGVDVIDYVFRLTLSDDTDVIEGLTTIEVRFREAGLSEVAFDLIGTAEGGTGMTVNGVWLADGLAESVVKAATLPEEGRGSRAPFAHDNDRLRVALVSSPAAGERRFVTVAYHGLAATGLKIGPNKHGDRTFFSDNWPSRARNWLPTVDHVSDKATSQMVVTAPQHYQVISNGLLVEETDLGDGTRRTWWRQSVPIAPWLYVLGVARFAVQHLEPFDGKPVQTWVYAQDRDAGFYDFAVPTHAVLEFYQNQVGPYAYEKLANIQSNSVGGGMEAASAIFYGDDSVTGDRSLRWRNVVIHEIAHQWFGNAVTEADWNDVWLSEGFATYFTQLFIEHAYGRDEFLDGMRAARDRVYAFYEERPDYRIVHANLEDMSQVTTGMQYQKGAWVLHMLRGIVGTETFWAGIRKYYAEHFNGSATTADFRRAMEEASGQELGWFFAQWLTRGGNPRLEGSWSWNPDSSEVVLQLRQVQDGEPFRLPLEVEVRAGGQAELHRVELDRSSGEFRLPASGPPDSVVLDPGTWMLVRGELRPH